jgi:hypothetical protein
MSVTYDISLHEGEPWLIEFHAHEADGTTAMPLTSGAEVEFRISDIDGNALLTRTVGDGITITNEINGIAQVSVTVAEQETSGITRDTMCFYEVRVIKAGLTSIQAEGRLKIESSLYASPPSELLLQFRARFPEFQEEDDVVELYIRDAASVVDRYDFWTDADQPIATVYLAAHFLQMRLNAQTAHESAGVETGPVRMIRVEDRTVSYDVSKNASTAGKSGLSQTFYGQYYLSMLRRYTRWLLRA